MDRVLSSGNVSIKEEEAKKKRDGASNAAAVTPHTHHSCCPEERQHHFKGGGSASPNSLDVTQYVGQTLIKRSHHHGSAGTQTPSTPGSGANNPSSSLRHQARVLTGMPLINFNANGQKSGSGHHHLHNNGSPRHNHHHQQHFDQGQQLQQQSSQQQQQHLAMLQQQHLSFLVAYYQHHQHQAAQYQLQLQQQQQQEECQAAAASTSEAGASPTTVSENTFVPRVLKPRRRRLTATASTRHLMTGSSAASSLKHTSSRHAKDLSGKSDESSVPFEIDLEDESHLLPTDLLLDSELFLSSGRRGSSESESLSDSCCSGESSNSSTSSSGSQEEKMVSQRPSPIRPPSRQKVRHTESLLQIRDFPGSANTNSISGGVGNGGGHFQLRKTFSWASPATNSLELSGNHSEWHQPLDSAASFSLFPKTSESDLLSSVRNNLVLITPEQQQQLLLSQQRFVEHQQQQLQQLPDVLNNNNDNNANKTVRTTDLEEALKSLSVENNETASLSRKFWLTRGGYFILREKNPEKNEFLTCARFRKKIIMHTF